jgi:nicotinate-nucleotide--dimethylbenzimidazole phosphoribosyltransferase
MSHPTATQAPNPDKDARAQACDVLDSLTKPRGSLGRLEDLVAWAAAVQGTAPPHEFVDPQLVIFAGDHGVATSGTSAYPSEVTAQMVANLAAGGAAANVLAERVDVSLTVADMAVDSDYEDLEVPDDVRQYRVRRSSGSIDRENALSVGDAEQSWGTGAAIADRLIDSGADLLIAGDMGIGNTTPVAALVARLTGSEPHFTCGRGTGINDETWMRKLAVVRDALWRTIELPDTPMVTVAALGGADIAAMAGFLTQGASRSTPALLDGVVSTAAALLAEQALPGAKQWWVASHRSTEPAHTIALEQLSLEPLLDLRMRLGEGTGALLALPILQSAIALATDMATFNSAGVSQQTPGSEHAHQ